MKNSHWYLITLNFCAFCQSVSGQDSLAPQRIREVIVTAQYAPTDVRNAITPVRVINRARIEQLGANNLEQLLGQELNLRIGQDPTLGSSLSMQGLDGRNVKILVDGVPVIGRMDGHIDLAQLNLANVERVEIIEGPGSVYYGADALAGVVNLITRRSQAEKWKAGLNGQWEQRGERSLYATTGARLGERALLLMGAGYDRFEGFDTSATIRNLLWNPKTQWYTDATLRFDARAGRIWQIKTAWFDEQIDNLGIIRRPQFKPYAFDEFYKTRRWNTTLLQEGAVFKKYYWNNVFSFNDFRREKQSIRTELESGEQSPLPGEQDTTRFASWMLRSVLARRDEDRRWQWLAGLDTRYDRGFGQRLLDPESPRAGESSQTDLAALGSLRFRPNAGGMLEGSLRAAWNSRYGGALIPSLNWKQRLGPVFVLRLNAAQGFRSPDLKELFFYFVDANHYIIGNPALRPERSDHLQLQLAATTEKGKNRFETTLNGFWNRLQDKIELYEFVETAGGIEPVQGDTATFRYAYFNLERYETHGATLRASWEYGPFRCELGGNLTGFLNPEHDDFSETPRFTYTRELNAALRWQHERLGWNAGIWMRSNDRFVRYFPETENGQTTVHQRIVSGYTSLDASAGKTMLKKRLNLSLGVRNLLDAQSAVISGSGGTGHTSGDNQAISPGRSLWVRAQVNISKS